MKSYTGILIIGVAAFLAGRWSAPPKTVHYTLPLPARAQVISDCRFTVGQMVSTHYDIIRTNGTRAPLADPIRVIGIRRESTESGWMIEIKDANGYRVDLDQSWLRNAPMPFGKSIDDGPLHSIQFKDLPPEARSNYLRYPRQTNVVMPEPTNQARNRIIGGIRVVESTNQPSFSLETGKAMATSTELIDRAYVAGLRAGHKLARSGGTPDDIDQIENCLRFASTNELARCLDELAAEKRSEQPTNGTK